METTNVQLPTGDRLQIPTGAETLRLKSYLIMCRNSTRDYAEFADLVDSMETQTAAVVLAGMDRYYCGQHSRKQWVATQLVRRLADPQPSDEHDTACRAPRRRPIGPRSGSAACRWRWRCWRRRGDGDPRHSGRAPRRLPPRPSVRGADPRRRPPADDRPVEFWPTAAIRAALETDDLTVWQRIVAAIKRDPYGRTARQVEEVLETARPYGVSKALAEVLSRTREHLEANERAEVARHVQLLLERSGLGQQEFASRIGVPSERLRGVPRAARPARRRR